MMFSLSVFRRSSIPFVVLALAFAGCEPFDTTSVAEPRGTLGEEIHKVFCGRFATDLYPADVTGAQTRLVCNGTTPTSSIPDGRLRALLENRPRLVEALDRTLPAEMEPELQDLLVSMLPFYDAPRELLPSNTRALGDLLVQLSGDPAVTAALARTSQRRGVMPPRTAFGLLRPVLSYPLLPQLADSFFSTIDEGGALEPEWNAVAEALALELATSELDDPDDPTVPSFRDLMLSPDDAFGPATPRYVVARDVRGLPIPAALDGSQGFVDLDVDGLADVDELDRFLDATGAVLDLPTPFEIADESGVTRDADGRALGTTSAPLYVYQEIERTALAGILREAMPLFDPTRPNILDLAHGMGPLLGTDAPKQKTYGAYALGYEGYDTPQSAMLDLVYGSMDLLRQPETRDVLTLLGILVRDHEEEVVPLIESGFYGDELGDRHPESDLAPGSELWDDVIRVGEWMAQSPGMIEAMLRALTDPRSQRLGPIFAETMRFKDAPSLNASDPNIRLAEQYWTVPVDRTQADAPGNMSLFQQTLSGIHELNYVELCNKQDARVVVFGIDVTGLLGGPWDRCELLFVPNAAEAFAQAVVGRAQLTLNLGPALQTLINLFPALSNGLLEVASGIDGLTQSPTPYALARLMYGPWNEFITNLVDRPVTVDGDRFDTRYSGRMVLAWERTFHFCGDRILDQGQTCPSAVQNVNLYDALTPLLTVFDDHDQRTNGRYLFGELVSAFHLHYATPANPMYQSTDPNGPRYVHPDGAISYEPIVSDLLSGCVWEPNGTARLCRPELAGRMISRLSRVALLLDQVQVRPGVDGIDVAAAAIERMVDPARNPALPSRSGATTTRTRSASRTMPNSPLLLVLDALNRMDDAHATDPASTERWLAARSRFVDLFLEPEALTNDQYRLRNRRLYAFLPILLDFVTAYVNEHQTRGDLMAWARSFDDDIEDALGGAMGARAVRFFDALGNHPETETAFLELATYLLDENGSSDAFGSVLVVSADMLYGGGDDAGVTLTKAFADAFASDARAAVAGSDVPKVSEAVVHHTIGLLDEANRIDDMQTFIRVLQNAIAYPAGELETPLEVVMDVVGEVNRATPDAAGPLFAIDYETVFGEVIEFLLDPIRGLERLFDIVQGRELP